MSANSDERCFEQRLQRLEARQQLMELVFRYCVATDDRDYAALEGMFTPDATFGKIRGFPAILAFFRERHASFGSTYHYVHAPHFDFQSADAASGVINSHAEIALGGRNVWMAIRYLDRYARIDGRWYFASRAQKLRYAMPFEELPDAYASPLRLRLPGTEPRAADLPETLPTWIAAQSSAGKG
jgi:hypothetical protein